MFLKRYLMIITVSVILVSYQYYSNENKGLGEKTIIEKVEIAHAGQALLNGEKINIQRAHRRDFRVIPGISDALALKIIHFREKKGKINDLNDLLSISGLGPHTLEKIKLYFKR